MTKMAALDFRDTADKYLRPAFVSLNLKASIGRKTSGDHLSAIDNN
jgi:hypothetical protein